MRPTADAPDRRHARPPPMRPPADAVARRALPKPHPRCRGEQWPAKLPRPAKWIDIRSYRAFVESKYFGIETGQD